MQAKVCSSCKRLLPITDFYKHKRSRDGYDWSCKACIKERSHKYYLSHKEEIVSYINEWNKKNKKRLQENRHNYYENCKKLGLIDREQKRKIYKKWYDENKDKAKQATYSWLLKNPHKKKEYDNKRRNRLGNSGFTAKEFNSLIVLYENKCLCCGRDDIKLTADHVIPLKLGGSNNIENIQPLCKSCNSKKHLKIIDYRLENRNAIQNSA